MPINIVYTPQKRTLTRNLLILFNSWHILLFFQLIIIFPKLSRENIVN